MDSRQRFLLVLIILFRLSDRRFISAQRCLSDRSADLGEFVIFFRCFLLRFFYSFGFNGRLQTIFVSLSCLFKFLLVMLKNMCEIPKSPLKSYFIAIFFRYFLLRFLYSLGFSGRLQTIFVSLSCLFKFLLVMLKNLMNTKKSIKILLLHEA